MRTHHTAPCVPVQLAGVFSCSSGHRTRWCRCWAECVARCTLNVGWWAFVHTRDWRLAAVDSMLAVDHGLWVMVLQDALLSWGCHLRGCSAILLCAGTEGQVWGCVYGTALVLHVQRVASKAYLSAAGCVGFSRAMPLPSRTDPDSQPRAGWRFLAVRSGVCLTCTRICCLV